MPLVFMGKSNLQANASGSHTVTHPAIENGARQQLFVVSPDAERNIWCVTGQ
jgi:hypothetical protein